MKKRLGTSAVILILTIGFVLLKQFHALFFDAFALVVSYCCLFEVLKIFKSNNKKINKLILYVVPAIECVIFNLTGGLLSFLLMIALAVLVLVYSLTCDILIYGKNRRLGTTEKDKDKLNAELFDLTKNTMSVFAYPLLPLSFLMAINHLPYEAGYVAIVLSFAIAMLTDSLAYVFGLSFGKTKFIPEVSPKKTIAGVFGGFVGGIVAVAACFLVFYNTNWFSVLNNFGKAQSIVLLMVVGLVASYVNQLGDLVASAYKRKANIKDFSNIFPGHGGFMDRVDGLMFVSVVVYIAFTIFIV